MSGAGFNGLGIIKSRRKAFSLSPFSVNLQGLTNGVAEHGTALTFSIDAGTLESYRWQMTSTNAAWFEIAGATAVSETVDLVGGRHTDGAMIRVGATSGGVEVFSKSVRLVYAQPTALVDGADVTLSRASGIDDYDVSWAFDGDNLSFEIEAEPFISIDPSTSLISFDTDQLTPQTSTALQVTARNSGGFDTFILSLTVLNHSAFSVSAVNGEPLITGAEGMLSFQLGNGIFIGTYDVRVTDNSPLTAEMVEAGPTPLVLPTISGTTALGGTLTRLQGLWLYAGTNPGAPSYQWFRDGVLIAGATEASHVVLADDQGTDITVRETFGGVTITSAATAITAGAAFAPSDLASYTDDFDASAAGAFDIQTGRVGAWENQGPSSNRFDMSNAAAQPIVLSAGLNGLDVVRFETGNYMQENISPAFGDNGTLMIVFRANAVSSAFDSLYSITGGTGTFQIDSGDITGGQFFGRINTNAHTELANPNSTLNDWTILGYRFDVATGFASLWIDGTKVDEVADFTGFGTSTRLAMGGSRNLSAKLPHDNAQTWRFDAALTDAEIGQMFTFAQTKWGIA